MPFREKAKSFFRRSRSDSLSKSSSKNSGSETSRDRWPSNVYKPGEPMPRPKYRAPPKKEHKEHLESFSFAEAWRRKSFQSQYSPMGTRAPSRRNSWLSTRRKSYRSARSGSVASTETGKSGVRQREHVHGAARATRLSTEVEQEGDDDVANVGMSRVQSLDRNPLSRPRTAEDDRPLSQPKGNLDAKTNGHKLYQPITAHDHTPFSEHDLALALNRSHLAVPAQ